MMFKHIYGQKERPLFITYQTGGQYVRRKDGGNWHGTSEAAMKILT
jgi:hypothetical protein